MAAGGHDSLDNDQDMESLLADSCGRCAGAQCDVICVMCKIPYHNKCVQSVSVWQSKEIICDECAASGHGGQDSLNKTIHTHSGAIRKSSFRPGEFKGNSTKSVPVNEYDELKRKFEEMEKLVRRLTCGPNEFERPEPRRHERLDVTQGRNVNQGNNSSEHTDRNAWNTTSSWREQVSRLNNSFGLNESVTLTREQRDNRKSLDTTLPRFNGDPDQWVTFILTYAQTTDACGFVAHENNKRLQASLHGNALLLVGEKLKHPRNVEEVMMRLEQAYGQPAILMAGMNKKVDRMERLQEDLSNLAEFLGDVEAVQDVFVVTGKDSSDSELFRKVELLLPIVYAREWSSIKKRSQKANLKDLVSYLNGLFEEAIAIGVSVIKKSTGHRKKFNDMEKPQTQRVLLASVEQKEKCPLQCENEHTLDLCPKFRQSDSRGRWNIIKKFKKCRVCFGPHFINECSQRRQCGINGCPGQHHNMLHFTKPKIAAVVTGGAPAVPTMTVQKQQAETHFRVLPVRLSSGTRTIETWAFWDAGAAVTFVTSNLAKKMHLSGPRSKLPLQWTDEDTTWHVDSEQVTLKIEPIDGGEIHEISAQTMAKLSLIRGTMTPGILHEEELNVPVNFNSDARPEILIGQDNAVVMRTLRSVVGKSGQIIASETPFGWIIEGRAGDMGAKRVMRIQQQEDPLETLVADYIENDDYGLIDDKDVIHESDQCLAARKIMETEVVYKDSRFYAGLLWINQDIVLPNNKEGALKRHMNFENKLRKQPDLWARVDSMIQMYLAKNYIRPAQGDGTEGRTWYLPIFTVINPAKPEKIRVVWDAAAKFHNRCLNDSLLSGPDLTSPLVDVLLRFRAGQYAVTGDIEEMFHRIIVQEKDRCAQRFFWRGSPDAELIVFEMCVLIFGASCSPTLAQFAKNMNADRVKNLLPEVAAAIKDNHYVDDFLQSADDERQLASLVVNVRDVHATGGFKIHKWESNSTLVMNALGVIGSNGSSEVSPIHACSVLGMIWNTTDDLLSFRLRREKLADGFLDGEAMPTKRIALRTVMSLYDPLGLLTFKTVEMKLILREAWRIGIDWDEYFPEGLRHRWNTWGKNAEAMQNILVPRWVGTKINDSVELHIFSDASENAVCAVAYVVQRSTGATMMCFSKCRVSSLKSKSVPRLELDAATLGVRVLKIVQKASPWLDVARVVMWTDARDVLFWLRSTERRYSVYVANRVSTILSSTTVDSWRWVPTRDNPADMGTKICKDKSPELWWKGPNFLSMDEDNWPNSFEKPEEELEIRRLGLVRAIKPDPIVPDLKNGTISSWIKLLRATARVRLAAYLLTKRIQVASDLTAADETWAEKQVFKMIQSQTKVGDLIKFSPFLDEDGIWRSRTRIVKGDFDRETRCPIILADHAGTRLLIQHYHHCEGDQNFFRTINELRRRYIIPRLRTLANKVVKSCRTCVVMNARPINPEMAALPPCRLAVGHAAFAYTGIDCFGPFDFLKFRRHEKKWGILFTCLTTRAVYIDLIGSMSADACIAAIESFVMRRGLPLQFRSDNGTNFVAAANKYRGPNGERPAWVFNPPGCPHMGGAWERLIGATKRALKKMDFSKIKTEEELRRALIKAEYIVNTRPMTEYPVDEDTLECLTPQHILDGRRSGIDPA